MINSVQPDIIIGTETHLDSDFSDTEFLPSNYKTHRKDRNKYGGGVLIALRDELFELSSRVHELETNCEILWIKLKSKDSKDLYICSYYRPDTGDAESSAQFEISVSRACSKENSKIVIAGDLNFPDYVWASMTLKPSGYPNLHRQFCDFLHDKGLEQLVLEPTRGENTLDLVMTNTPHLVPRIETIPGISDHEIVFFEYTNNLLSHTQTQRPVSVYKKADWQSMRQSFNEVRTELQRLHSDNADVESMWQYFHDQYTNIVKTNIPTKILKKKVNHPWIKPDIKKLMKRRDQKFRKLKKKQVQKS